MSARKIGSSPGAFSPVTVQTRQTRLSLSPADVRIRKSGIEFRSATSIAAWTEMTVTLEPTSDTGRVHCTGVVVACNGSRHNGYIVSLAFTSLSKQSQERLDQMAFS